MAAGLPNLPRLWQETADRAARFVLRGFLEPQVPAASEAPLRRGKSARRARQRPARRRRRCSLGSLVSRKCAIGVSPSVSDHRDAARGHAGAGCIVADVLDESRVVAEERRPVREALDLEIVAVEKKVERGNRRNAH